MFECEIKIHKKPRGNWRPRVDISIKIRAEDYPHRPKLKGVRLAWRCTRCDTCEYNFDIDGISDSDKWESVFPLPDKIFNDKRKGIMYDPDGSSYSCEKGKAFRFFRVVYENYLDEDIEKTWSFYLPWRPGAKPDYSDFVSIFKKIPSAIERQLKEGLDSGESDEIIISSDSVKTESIAKELKEGKKPSRKLKIA